MPRLTHEQQHEQLQPLLRRFRELLLARPGHNEAALWDDFLHRIRFAPAGEAGDHDLLANVSPDDHHARDHGIAGVTHTGFPGTLDEFLRGDGSFAVPAGGAAQTRLRVGGTDIGTQDWINLIAGAGIAITGADDPTNAEVEATIEATGGGGGTSPGAHLTPVGVTPATANSDTTLHTAAADEEVWLDIANIAGATVKVRVAIRPGGALIANEHYRIFDTAVSAGINVPRLGPYYLTNTDVLTVRVDTAAGATFALDGRGGEFTHITPTGVAPADTAVTTLFTASADTEVWLRVANIGGGEPKATYAISPGGAALANEHYRGREINVGVGDFRAGLGPHYLQANDVVRVQSSIANALAFGLDGRQR